MESAPITESELRVVRALQGAGSERWFSNREIADDAGISTRTATLYTTRLVALGVVEQAEVYPHRFRWCGQASKKNGAYVKRLTKAFEACGMNGEG